ncbi:MAG: hypothetical protein ABTS22_20725 [Accumulibacter sp.]|uniref:hypothetical protein n=1 Tax=Accumulibacter sp. TaxID=2053492 RepID=UPI0033160DCA
MQNPNPKVLNFLFRQFSPQQQENISVNMGKPFEDYAKEVATQENDIMDAYETVYADNNYKF